MAVSAIWTNLSGLISVTGGLWITEKHILAEVYCVSLVI